MSKYLRMIYRSGLHLPQKLAQMVSLIHLPSVRLAIYDLSIVITWIGLAESLLTFNLISLSLWAALLSGLLLVTQELRRNVAASNRLFDLHLDERYSRPSTRRL